MIRVFPPSEIEHPWRETLALLSISVWVSIALAWITLGPLLGLLRWLGPVDWHFDTGELGT